MTALAVKRRDRKEWRTHYPTYSGTRARSGAELSVYPNTTPGDSLRRRPGEQRWTLQELAIPLCIEVVLIAHVLAHTHVFPQHQCRANRPRLREDLRILDQRLVVDLVAVDTREPFRHAQRVTGKRPVGHPTAFLELRGLDDQRVAIPAGDGVAEKCRFDIGRERPTDRNTPEHVEVFVQDDDLVLRLHEFDWEQSDRSDARRRLWNAERRRVVH